MPFRRLGTLIKDYSYFLVPYYKNGTLKDIIKRAKHCPQFFDMETRLYLCAEVVRAVLELHSTHNMAHRNISVENLYLSDAFNLILTKFTHLEPLDGQSDDNRVG